MSSETESKNSVANTSLRWLAVLVSGVGIALLPPPEGVTREAWTLLAIFVATIVGSIAQPMTGSAMVLFGVIATAIFRALPIEKTLSGYADKFVWLVLAAFFISRAMIKTGLGHRIALIFIRLIGRRTLGLGYSLVFTDFILASFVPSTGARSGGIILPIARSVSETYDSRPDDGTAGRLGTFLMNLLYQCEVILCATFLTGQASNVIIAGFAAKQANIELTYSIWFISAIVPALVSLTVVPLMIYKFFPPEIKETPNAVIFAHNELEKLGSLSFKEKILLVVFVLVVILWITARWHGIDSTVIALFGIATLLITRVLDWSDVTDERHAWEVFIWYGGLVMMATALGETNIPKLFLRSLRFREYHGARHGDVQSIFGGNCRRWGSGRIDRLSAHLLFKSKCRIDALRHHARSSLFRNRLRQTESVVDDRSDRVGDQYNDLVDRRARLVEAARLVVNKRSVQPEEVTRIRFVQN